jgi:hypothetical protein
MQFENKVYEALKLLTPYDINIQKARVGSPWDGGYILADNRTPDQVVMSYGIGGEVSFDYEMAMKGHQCYMFDHTTTGLPANHPNFHFYREGVAPVNEPEKSLFTVQDHLDRFSINGNRLILKMDVEGAEWDAISQMSDATISRFEQIVIEVHHFCRMEDPVFLDKVLASLRKIKKFFTLFHVHPNNNNPMATVAGFSIYNLMELSYIKSSIVESKASRTLYPTELDNPNEQDRDDYMLSIFPYWPTGLSTAEYDEHVRRFTVKNESIVKSTKLYQEHVKHFQVSNLEQAEICLRECLRIRPSLYAASNALLNVLNMKAIDLFNKRRFSEAVTNLREALELSPNHPDVMRNLEVALSAASSTPIH